nr:hypothetical protein [Tanacetum cinerariifolium]
MIRLRAEADVTLPPRKRLCIDFGPIFEAGECLSALIARPTGGFRADYGFVGTLDAEIRHDPDKEISYEITDVWEDPDEIVEEVPVTDVAELGQRMTYFITTVRQDTDEIYGRLDDAQDDRLLMRGQLNMLHRDRCSHARTAKLMESEARLSCEAWVQSMDASYMARAEVMSLRTTVLAQTTRSTPATTTTTTTTPMTNAQLKVLIDQGVADALAVRDADKSQNGKDNHDSRTGVRIQAHPACECIYPGFMKCKPLYFKGTEGVFEFTQWFKRMETVFRISNCTMENQIKFATCILLGSALTWWNSYVKTVGHDVAYAMTWTNLEKKITDKYCPRGEIKKLEVEIWNLKVKESDKIERYVDGLPDMIHGSVMASKPKTIPDAVKFATELMDKMIRTFAERHTKNKRKFKDTSKKNQNQQQNKKQNTGRAYIT